MRLRTPSRASCNSGNLPYPQQLTGCRTNAPLSPSAVQRACLTTVNSWKPSPGADYHRSCHWREDSTGFRADRRETLDDTTCEAAGHHWIVTCAKESKDFSHHTLCLIRFE